MSKCNQCINKKHLNLHNVHNKNPAKFSCMLYVSLKMVKPALRVVKNGKTCSSCRLKW